MFKLFVTESPEPGFFRLVELAIKQREVAKWHDGFGPVWKARTGRTGIIDTL